MSTETTRFPHKLSLISAIAAVLLCAAFQALAQKSDPLALKFPDADIGVQEVSEGLYSYHILKETQVFSLSDHIGSSNDIGIDYSPSYLGKNLVFEGKISSFVTLLGSRDGRSRIISVASLDYDPANLVNPPLAPLGVVALDRFGIVKSDKAKSGWINWAALVEINDAGQPRKLRLSDVTFWLNRGGDNWLSFSVGSARELSSNGAPGAEVPVKVTVDTAGSNRKATIRVDDKFTFVPWIKDHHTLMLLTVDSAIAMLDGPDPETRLRVVNALAAFTEPRALDALALLKDDTNLPIRNAAAMALVDHKDRRAVEPLIRMLRDHESSIRLQAANALGTLASSKATQPLTAVLSDSDADVRAAAIASLGKLNDKTAAPALVRLLHDPDPGIRGLAVYSLGQIKAAAAAKSLAFTLNTESNADVKSRILVALGQITGKEFTTYAQWSAYLSSPKPRGTR